MLWATHIQRLRIGMVAFGLGWFGATAQAQPQVITCDEPGWGWVDVGIVLTANQPTYWSAATGSGGDDGVDVSPFTILDPGVLPGRPANDGTDERVLRGFIMAWAVDANGAEIRWNHLKGDALIVNYARGSAWEYNAYQFQAVNPAILNGQGLGVDPGHLRLDGNEYDNGYDLLLLDFYAAGVRPPGVDSFYALDTDLTLMPLSIDVRQESDGPVTTKASFTIWNQNETKLTGLDRCITCWDSTLFTLYGVPNHLVRENLQTDKGKAQIDGLPSQLCNHDYDQGDGLALGADPRDVVSAAASLIGVEVKQLGFDDPTRLQFRFDSAGEHIAGMGVQSGSIQADIIGQDPPERPTGPADASPAAILPVRFTPGSASNQHYPPPMVLAPGDRLSTSEKGSLVVFPKVELRWDASGRDLLQDTFIDLTNDFPGDVFVQMYFVQGDPPFVSSGIDLNSNGVSDECETRYTCAGGGGGKAIGVCAPDPAGEYETLQECRDSCATEVHWCSPNDNLCHFLYRPWSYLDQPYYYATPEECSANCGSFYDCTETANGPECVPAPQGSFATLADCQTACQRYRCEADDARGGVGGVCVPDPAGPYATLSACEANCSDN